MQGLSWIPHLSAQSWIAIAAVVVLLGVLLIVRATRQRTTVADSETVETIAYQLGRIADALERAEPWRRSSFVSGAMTDGPAIASRSVDEQPIDQPPERVRHVETDAVDVVATDTRPRDRVPAPSDRSRHVTMSIFGR
jgi:hypothetical protein